MSAGKHNTITDNALNYFQWTVVQTCVKVVVPKNCPLQNKHFHIQNNELFMFDDFI
jgi:hypothetical protein